MTEEQIFKILHAHTRATTIRYLALPPTFRKLDDLKFFLDHYYNYTFIPSYEDPFEPSFITGHSVGHPSGNICTIGYKTSNPLVDELLQSYDDPIYGVFIQREPLDIHDHENASPNWSTIELDQPYAFCTSCDELIHPLPPPSLCSSCLNKSDL